MHPHATSPILMKPSKLHAFAASKGLMHAFSREIGSD
jgi:hypothetical protein